MKLVLNIKEYRLATGMTQESLLKNSHQCIYVKNIC